MSATDPRVLFLLASTSRRGAEIQAAGIAAGLSARGLPVDVVGLAPGSKGPQLDVRALGSSPRSISTFRALRRAVRSADVVVAYGSSTLPACAIALAGTGVPFVYRNIGDPGEWVRPGWHQTRTRLLMRRAAHIAALWPGSAASIQRLYRIPADRISVIANARDAIALQPPTAEARSAARSTFGIDADERVAVIVGALVDEKHVHIALQSLARVSGVRALVAGDGPMRAELETLASATMPGRVEFLGTVPDIVPVLHAADVILLTSRTEGLPGALIEAGLCGVPAVATDVGGVREIVDDQRTGRLVPVGDVDEIVSALNFVFEHRAPLSGAAREHCARRFGLDSALDAWEMLLRHANTTAD